MCVIMSVFFSQHCRNQAADPIHIGTLNRTGCSVSILLLAHNDDSTSLVMITMDSGLLVSSTDSLMISRDVAEALVTVGVLASHDFFASTAPSGGFAESAAPQQSFGAHCVLQESSQSDVRESEFMVTNSGWMVVAWMPSSWKKSLIRLATSM